MSRKYPQYQYEHSAHLEGYECCACSKPASKNVRIAWDYMRGNDSDVPVCSRHFKMIENTPDRFFAHMFTKDKFVAEKSE